MEKRKDHFSDWQLPSQTSFNKRGKKSFKGPASCFPPPQRGPGHPGTRAGATLHWCCGSQTLVPPWGLSAARALEEQGAAGLVAAEGLEK